MSKKPPKPRQNPTAKRMADLASVNLQPDAVNLPRQADIEVTRSGHQREGRRVQDDSARRLDAFSALKDGMAPGAFDAAKRLERDIHIRYGLHDHGRPEKVDCEPQKFDRTDKMIMAGERVDDVLSRLGDREGILLTELIMPQPQHPTWRDVVLHWMGEINPHAQCAVVRLACMNLRDAYERTAKRRAAA